MGLGTAAVLGTFGYYIGQSTMIIRRRAANLDELNRSISEQKSAFEFKFQNLNANLKNFHTSNARIQKSLDSNEVLQLAADALHAILGYDRVNILMLDPAGTQLELVASHGTDSLSSRRISHPFDRRAGILFQTLQENRLVLVEDMQQLPAEARLSPPWDAYPQLRSRSFIICPITEHGRAIGLIAVDNKVQRKALDDTDTDTVRLFADQVSATLSKIQLLSGVESLITQLQLTFSESRRYSAQFAELIRSLKAGASATTGTIAEVATAAEEVRAGVDDTVSATNEISTAIEEVTGNLDRLQQFMEASITAMTEITATAREVEANAARSQNMSEQVKQHAEDGVRTVNDAFLGLQGISRSVNQASDVITALADKGEEIERIIAIIHEINQKTNLLSLNASIIAAQAGEHGRSFAVVAEEIRTLSQETGQSASSIETLVAEIRALNRQAVQHIGDTGKLVERDVSLGRETEQVLTRILASAAEATTMTRNIGKATAEQVRSAQSVARSIEELGGMSTQLSHASREQVQGIRRIVNVVEEIKGMATEMAAATARQTQATRQIDSEVDQVSQMSGRVFSALSDREGESYRVIEQLEAVKGPGGTKH
jgi:methyl-accepting chemotaxis protein